MLLLANKKTNTITEVMAMHIADKENPDVRYFNKDTFQKNEPIKARNWLDGNSDSYSRYTKEMELICNNPIKVFFDLEFHVVSKEILSIGFVVTRNNEIIERFFSLVRNITPLTEEDETKLHMKQAELNDAPYLSEVLTEVDKIIKNYLSATFFVWGNQDAVIMKEQTMEIESVVAENIKTAIDFQSVLCKKFSIPIISLENALKLSDYFYKNIHNALDNATALMFAYYQAETCWDSFVKGLYEYAKFHSSKKSLIAFKTLEANMEHYAEEIERLSGNNNIKDQKKLRSICGKQEKFLAKQKSLNIPELEKFVNNNIFA